MRRAPALPPLLPLLLLAALAATPLASAASAPVVDATVTGLSLHGAHRVAGSLAAFHSTGDELAPTADPAQQRVAPAIHLFAHSLRIETDTQEATGNSVFSVPTFPTAPAQTMDDANATLQVARQGFRFFLAPLPGHVLPTILANGDQASLAPADGGVSEPTHPVRTDRAPLTGAPGAAVALGDGSGEHLSVTGDFLLSLWEWDLLATNATTSVLAPSGYTYDAYGPTLPPNNLTTVGHYREREVYVTAQGATFDAAIPAGAASELLLRPGQATVSGRVVLQGPAGTVATPGGQRPLVDGDWVEGAFSVAFDRAGANGFGVAMGGAPTTASLDGQLVPFPAPAHRVAAAPILLGAGLVTVAGAGAGGRTLSAAFGVRRVRDAMARGDYGEVVERATPRLMRKRKHGDSIRTQRAVALLVLGRPSEAAEALQGWTTGPAATLHFLWACVHAALGQTSLSEDRVRACLASDPVLGRHLLGDPLLASIRKPASPPASPSIPMHSEGYM